MNVDRYRSELAKQLRFIERSCVLFDEGHVEEAIRIGTAIRVLVHDTRRSRSLLTHLGIKGDITLLSTCRPLTGGPNQPPGMMPVSAHGLGVVRYGLDGTAVYFPLLGNLPFQAFVAVDEWWRHVVWRLDSETELTRRDLVLVAANKDGGAHVDAETTPEYERLANLVFADPTCLDPELARRQQANLVSLRQLGFEVLNSPDLVSGSGGDVHGGETS